MTVILAEQQGPRLHSATKKSPCSARCYRGKPRCVNCGHGLSRRIIPDSRQGSLLQGSEVCNRTSESQQTPLQIGCLKLSVAHQQKPRRAKCITRTPGGAIMFEWIFGLG